MSRTRWVEGVCLQPITELEARMYEDAHLAGFTEALALYESAVEMGEPAQIFLSENMRPVVLAPDVGMSEEAVLGIIADIGSRK